MSQYYKHDLARWEGEGGAHGELLPPWHNDLHSNEDFHSPSRSNRRHDCAAPSIPRDIGQRAVTQTRSEMYCLEERD